MLSQGAPGQEQPNINYPPSLGWNNYLSNQLAIAEKKVTEDMTHNNFLSLDNRNFNRVDNKQNNIRDQLDIIKKEEDLIQNAPYMLI